MARSRRKSSAVADVRLPSTLIESVRAQRVVLFLGAGASMEAKGPGAQKPPSGEGLRDLLTEKFLGRKLPRHDLMSAAELCIDASGSSLVFDYIREVLSVFSPSTAHKLVPLFPWRAIATTNYDILVERSYAEVSQRTQNLVRLIKDREPVDERLRQVSNPLLYLKLHGCLDNIQDGEVPPILSHEHYARYSRNRTRLFSRLEDMAQELPFVFCGYRLADPHIRNLVYQLEAGRQRPRWYIVAPGVEPEEVQSWASRNVEVIDAKFGEFMSALDREVPPIWRALKFKSEVADLPIRRFYKTNKVESPALREAIDRDLTFVHGDIRHAEQEPKKFYEGFDTGWGCVVQRLDVRRKYIEEVIYKAFMDEPSSSEPRLFVLKGPGGSGKTVALKRIAWEAATQLNEAPVLWFEQDGALQPDHILELHGLTDKRVFVFVDRLALHTSHVGTLLASAKKNRIPVTVVGAERDSEWNVYCTSLEKWNPSVTRVPNLSKNDVETLIDLLDRYNCLGLLAGRPRQDQIDAFMNTAERQLLVALHEATHGKKLVDIVFDEYNDVTPEQARRLYLDIATMHQFAVPVRAGTISRVSGVRFNEYESKFLKPLENVVVTGQDAHTGDHNYRARHSRIASLVFNQACPTDEEKSDQLIRIIDGLDPGYTVDNHALLEITRGRNLSKTMVGVEAGRSVYRAAARMAPEIGFVDQQWAIFESNHVGGSLSEAEMLAKRARTKDKNSNSIIHTQAEIARKRANAEHSPLLKEQFRRQARERLSEMRPASSVLVASTRCKLIVDEIADLSDQIDDTSSAADLNFFAEKVKDAERALDRATANYAGDPDLAETEARLLTLMNEKRAARRALERAWSLNPRGAGVATRLAAAYAESGELKKSVDLLENAIEKNPDDRNLHLTLARYLIQQKPDDPRIEPHLSASYVRGDAAFEARYVHAQYLLFRGRGQDAVQLFDQVDGGAPPDFRRQAQSPKAKQAVVERLLPRITATVSGLNSSYVFLKCPFYPKDVFAHSDNSDPRIWEELTFGLEVNFEARFNRKGLLAFDIQLGRYAD